jgi:hypothetical protein
MRRAAESACTIALVAPPKGHPEGRGRGPLNRRPLSGARDGTAFDRARMLSLAVSPVLSARVRFFAGWGGRESLDPLPRSPGRAFRPGAPARTEPAAQAWDPRARAGTVHPGARLIRIGRAAFGGHRPILLTPERPGAGSISAFQTPHRSTADRLGRATRPRHASSGRFGRTSTHPPCPGESPEAGWGCAGCAARGGEGGRGNLKAPPKVTAGL